MKICIAYPPFRTKKGIPQISQNRQFQWTAGGVLSYAIYPVAAAYAATMLSEAGHEVFWLDGVAERWSFDRWMKELLKAKPDIVVFESKTPVIERHWELINELKKSSFLFSPRGNRLGIQPGATPGALPLIVLTGDHVTALPEESFKNSQVDYVLTGGDWDFLLVNLVRYLDKGEKLAPGIYKKVQKFKSSKAQSGREKIESTGKFTLDHNLNKLPLIDRDLTKWRLYAYRNSNFFRTPGAYTMFGRDCWWGRCSFCSWTTLYPGEKYRIFSVEKAIAEIKNLVENYGVKEIMDDSGTFANGIWLRDFCHKMIETGLNRRVKINCNMRFGAGLGQKDYQLMGKAGFRFVLYGLESASQATLDRLNKNLKVEQIEPVLDMAKKAGLRPHITVMVGYPWEGKKELRKTIALVKKLFQRGLVDSMQATVVIPYPGTPLFAQCEKKHWLKNKNWNEYDMRRPMMKSKLSDKELAAAVRELYHVSVWNKTFIANTVHCLSSWEGIKHVGFQALKYLGKMWEFKDKNLHDTKI